MKINPYANNFITTMEAKENTLASPTTVPSASLKQSQIAQNPEKLKKLQDAEKVATEFETLFMDLVLKGMRQTAKPENQDNATEIYTSMLDSERTKTMTESQEFGIRSLIMDWLKSNDPEFASMANDLSNLKSSQNAAFAAYKSADIKSSK
jgi:Rod binding domain-containing protein